MESTREVVRYVDDAEWDRLIDQLRDGLCTPFLGAGASYGSLPTGSEVSRAWADRHKYPFPDDGDLAHVMQFAAVTVRESMWVKERLCREFRSANAPDFTDPLEPHALLASFPIPVYLTTNYDDFMSRALTLKGKAPNQVICPWYKEAEYQEQFFRSEPGLSPRPESPLVYHLHGSMRKPESLVLTEEDYLEFLVNITEDKAGNDRRLVPSSIQLALTDRPLLFIGYSLQDWTFRVLFHGLIRNIPNIRRRRGVSVQFRPRVNEQRDDAEKRAKEYLSRYLEDWKISIYWGTAREFCEELRERMGPVNASR